MGRARRWWTLAGGSLFSIVLLLATWAQPVGAAEAWTSTSVSPLGNYDSESGYEFIPGVVYNLKSTPEPASIGVTYSQLSNASVSVNGGASQVTAGYVMTMEDSSTGRFQSSQSINGSMPDIELGDPYIGSAGSSAVFDTFFKAYEDGEIALSWDAFVNVVTDDGLAADGGIYILVEKGISATRSNVFRKKYRAKSGTYQERFTDSVILPVEKDTYYHIHMSTGFSVRDFLDDTSYSYQSTSSLEFERDSCTVQTLNPWKIPSQDNTDNGEIPLTRDMQNRVTRFEAELRKEDPNVSSAVTSAQRNRNYQDHFFDIGRVNDALIAHSEIDGQSGSFVTLGDEGRKCGGVIRDVEREIAKHGLEVDESTGKLLVDHPDVSTHVRGTGVDISIESAVLSQADIDRIAGSAGIRLRRPRNGLHGGQHFEVMEGRPQQQIQIRGESPVNLLLEDSQGRRLGYDPTSGSIVNDFGTDAYYSGPGSQPQVLELPPNALQTGNYTISGVGTGDGEYAIRVITSGEGGVLRDEIIATGVTSAQEPIVTLQTPLYYGQVFGDFSGDQELGVDDIELLIAALRTNSSDLIYDLDADQSVDSKDLGLWVKELFGTYLGDVNLDGEFNSSDLVSALSSGQYEDNVTGNSTWVTGDWDADGDFTSSDLVEALAGGAYEQGPRAAVSAVPEPSGMAIMTIAILALASASRSRR